MNKSDNWRKNNFFFLFFLIFSKYLFVHINHEKINCYHIYE
jgi:hypothetical protein